MKSLIYTTVALATTSYASADVLMDQIGPNDGTGIDTSNITANQDFEADFDIYDIATCDDFNGDGSEITSVEMVLGGWNGFVDASGVEGWTVNLYSGADAAGASLVGDIASQVIDAADAIANPDWYDTATFLIGMETSIASITGQQWIAAIPANPFGTNGQTGVGVSTVADDGTCIQANPGEGFGFGPYQAVGTAAAYRVATGGPADPCTFPLPESCTADVDGDLIVSVSDILAIVGNWGQCGDGTYRPLGDIAPLPNGDCCVNVEDLLTVIGSWGTDCTPRGACCSDVGVCTDELTLDECSATGGSYLGDDTTCADGLCLLGGCCLDEASCIEVSSSYCSEVGGIFRGDGTACADISCSAECNAQGCQLPDLGGHGASSTIGATSDTNPAAGYIVADNFHPTAAGTITQACWWGLYIDFSGPTDCGIDGPGTGDSFTISYYLDDGDMSTPGTLYAGPFAVSASANPTGEYIPSSIGDLTQYQYSASHPPVDVEGNSCYWISISNQTTETCFWLWETAPMGDGRSAQDNGGWASSDYDLGFCVDVDISSDACGVFTGPCCLTDGTCEIMSSMDCLAMEGEYRGDNLTCADVNNCEPIPGACCFPDFCIDETTDEECEAFAGQFMGEDTTCADVDCTPNPYDQIGMSDGSSLGTNITACQIFELDFAQYDVATLDNFAFDSAANITSIEAVVNGWNGYSDISSISNYTISVYSSPEAAGADLVGDVYSVDIIAPDSIPAWTGEGELVLFNINLALPAGEYYFAVIPWNEYGVAGQTGIADSTIGDGTSYQANPGGGFGFGAWQEQAGDSAYRLMVE